MAKLTDFKLLSFDVYGTLIDWERGALTALQPILKTTQNRDLDEKHILSVLHTIESDVEKQHPGWKYADVLTAVHPKLCQELGLVTPSAEQSRAFGASVGSWPAFPDTVAALKRLQRTYKLVVLSNVDNDSFRAGNAEALEGFEFDAVYTAEDIGSYKPNLRNFEYMLAHVNEEFGVERGKVLQTAQSQFHDHHPAKEVGISSSWIYRPGAVMGNREDPVFTWKFDTLADMADGVDQELAEKN
ncbi:haloacid dehalogenase [Didymella exigua CBS 183.55]|uniref:Haloacid dehalogenase n=1 Tax=Didymella exigua CBS 183.55 TaxID=1150837 RepID=A0A6A5RG48_9PLEO|nr:haloacid dehalogenase [Didymella exigua CBS 183.55]KAF1927311.1 haloacid dehalogenase [Didymella exigua CBS 183.55]